VNHKTDSKHASILGPPMYYLFLLMPRHLPDISWPLKSDMPPLRNNEIILYHMPSLICLLHTNFFTVSDDRPSFASNQRSDQREWPCKLRWNTSYQYLAMIKIKSMHLVKGAGFPTKHGEAVSSLLNFCLVMAALCNRGPLYFCPVVSFLLSSSIFFFLA